MPKTKDLLKKNKEKIISLPISKFINTKYRDYAIYVLEQRGIPNFYDALTPVQRYVLKNTPTTFCKTLSVIGKTVQDSYHHGNAALENCIARMARPFANSMQILEGYGFFGSEISPSPAASRYTSVKLSSLSNSIINKYDHLTTRIKDGPYDPFWLEVPLGLVIPVVGIAVGYKTTILPRKLKDIQEFFEGKRKNVKPYFEGFNGNIEKYKHIDKAWIISSSISIENRRICVREIPPILKYTSVLKKLDYLFSKYESNIKIVNNSNTKVNIDIIYNGNNKDEWNDVVNYINKIFSIIVTESIIFIKDGQVLIYDSLEQYLEDFKWQLKRLKYKNTEYECNKLDFELKYNKAKELFIKFILEKKRTDKEIDNWLKDYDKDVVDRLERLTARKFTIDEINLTKENIKRLINELKDKKKELVEDKNIFENYTDPTLKRGISSKKSTVNLFEVEDIKEDNGITIWDGEDIYEEIEQKLVDN